MAGYYTTFEGVTVEWTEAGVWNREPVGPTAAVSFPGDEWDGVKLIRRFATADEAKSSAKELAERIKPLKPKGLVGFYANPRLNGKPEIVAAREAVERIVREWAGGTPYVVEV